MEIDLALHHSTTPPPRREHAKRIETSPRYSNPILTEDRWRLPAATDSAQSIPGGQVVVSRWRLDQVESKELLSYNDDDHHIIGINLKSTSLTFSQSGRTIFDGHAMPGAIQVTCPGDKMTAVFHMPCDVIHLHVSRKFLSRHYEEASGSPYPGNIVMSDPHIFQDIVIERLGRALASAQELGEVFGALYVDSISLAIVARLLTRQFEPRLPAADAAKVIPRWRLHRAIDFMEAHLSEPIRLADISASVGLTRMHFASQFRIATGFTPHAYLLHRRLEHAQMLLLKSNLSILEIALNSGFASHAHFTTVFKRMIGAPPRRWRTNTKGELT
jgi:AraC-like DNA-binding protein